MIEAVLELESSSLLFGMEATGHYHQALAHFLSSLGYNVGLFNLLQTNRLREVDLRRVKTDKIDAKVITKALVLGAIINPFLLLLWIPLNSKRFQDLDLN